MAFRTSATERVREARDRDQLRKMRLQKEAHLANAKQAEIVTTLVETAYWTDFLLPMLEADMQQFQDHDSWDAPMDYDPANPGKSFIERRAAAFRSRQIRDAVLTRVGKREDYLKEAERIGCLLEEAE